MIVAFDRRHLIGLGRTGGRLNSSWRMTMSRHQASLILRLSSTPKRAVIPEAVQAAVDLARLKNECLAACTARPAYPSS